VQTIGQIEVAKELVKKAGLRHKQVMIIGTSKHINKIPAEYSAKFLGETMPYISKCWVGGCLTNWQTVRKTLKYIDKVESIITNKPFFEKLSRNEQLEKQREYDRKIRNFGGIRVLKNNKPGVIIVLDTENAQAAIKEAEIMRVPLILLTNTNTVYLPKSPKTKVITLVINNKSLNAVKLVLDELVASYGEGISAIVEKKETKESVAA
jgi:small subunit ribosomal protein S2